MYGFIRCQSCFFKRPITYILLQLIIFFNVHISINLRLYSKNNALNFFILEYIFLTTLFCLTGYWLIIRKIVSCMYIYIVSSRKIYIKLKYIYVSLFLLKKRINLIFIYKNSIYTLYILIRGRLFVLTYNGFVSSSTVQVFPDFSSVSSQAL